MPIVLVAKEESEYKQWVAEMKAVQAAESAGASKTWSKADLMGKGEAVYGTNCVACHQANGEGIPGVFAALKGSPIATGPIKDHINIVLNGKAGTAMAAFGAQLSDVDLAAVITYERNAWGNDTGDVVQPSEVKAAR
jgi:cytochrome c oxidase subunit 2